MPLYPFNTNSFLTWLLTSWNVYAEFPDYRSKEATAIYGKPEPNLYVYSVFLDSQTLLTSRSINNKREYSGFLNYLKEDFDYLESCLLSLSLYKLRTAM